MSIEAIAYKLTNEVEFMESILSEEEVILYVNSFLERSVKESRKDQSKLKELKIL